MFSHQRTIRDVVLSFCAFAAALAAVAIPRAPAARQAEPGPFDLEIRNGHIIDGTGRRGIRAISEFATAASPPSEISRLPPLSALSMPKGSSSLLDSSICSANPT